MREYLEVVTFLIGFNRYIVECKEESSQPVIYVALDLIDTLWNVKNHTHLLAEI